MLSGLRLPAEGGGTVIQKSILRRPGRPAGLTLGTGVPALRLALGWHWLATGWLQRRYTGEAIIIGDTPSGYIPSEGSHKHDVWGPGVETGFGGNGFTSRIMGLMRHRASVA